MRNYLVDRIFTLLLYAAGLLAIIAVLLFVVPKIIHLTYIECPGVIKEFRRRGINGEGIAPVITYEVDGVSYEFESSFYYTGMEIGDQVVVLHNAKNPSKASLKAGAPLASMIVGVISLILFTISIVYMIIRDR